MCKSLSMRPFASIDLGREPVPEETAVCRFRHLLERHSFGRRLFKQVGRHVSNQCMKVFRGAIVDATIITAPSSTKNRSGKRDPQMRQTKKEIVVLRHEGHMGVDSKTRLIHSAVATPANAHNSQALGQLLYGGETHMGSDSAYIGHTQVIRRVAPRAGGFALVSDILTGRFRITETARDLGEYKGPRKG